jgi:ADP-ribose pyrophosphatase YjhB (NUDIX family)
MTKSRRVCVRGIIYRDGKIFGQQLKAHSDYDFWCTPGGGLDPDEPLLDGLHREMIEETGVAPKIGRLLFVQQFIDGDREFLEFFFHIENAADYENIDLSATTHGELEIAHYGFIDPTAENLLPAPLQTIDYEKYIGSVQPVVIMNQFGEKPH